MVPKMRAIERSRSGESQLRCDFFISSKIQKSYSLRKSCRKALFFYTLSNYQGFGGRAWNPGSYNRILNLNHDFRVLWI